MVTEKYKHKIIISCEHGGNHVPPEYREQFRGKQSILQSHRGRDSGALELAKALAAKIKAPLFFSETTRLLVDLNRSLQHRHLFSEFTRNCDAELKTEILARHYHPYRKKLENEIRKLLSKNGTVLHFSVHSFTPRLGKVVRHADIGLLFDPRRRNEQILCHNLQTLLRNAAKGLVVRRNYPYRGTADGFTTYLRKRYGERQYLGIEIEINQKHVHGNRAQWKRLQKQIINAMEVTIRQTVKSTGSQC